jgi:hypothetical protein
MALRERGADAAVRESSMERNGSPHRGATYMPPLSIALAVVLNADCGIATNLTVNFANSIRGGRSETESPSRDRTKKTYVVCPANSFSRFF